MSVGVIHVGARADGDVHLAAFLGEDDVAGPVASSAHARTAGKTRNDDLRRTACLQISVGIGEANHGIGVADINPLGIATRRIEGDAKRPL